MSKKLNKIDSLFLLSRLIWTALIIHEKSGLAALGALFASANLKELGNDAENISYGTRILIEMFLDHQKEKLDKIHEKAVETQELLKARAKKIKEKGTLLSPK